jgi:hypothetical protein
MQTEETWTGEGNEEIGAEEGAGDVAEKQVVRKGKRSGTVAGVNTISTSTDTSGSLSAALALACGLALTALCSFALVFFRPFTQLARARRRAKTRSDRPR